MRPHADRLSHAYWNHDSKQTDVYDNCLPNNNSARCRARCLPLTGLFCIHDMMQNLKMCSATPYRSALQAPAQTVELPGSWQEPAPADWIQASASRAHPVQLKFDGKNITRRTQTQFMPRALSGEDRCCLDASGASSKADRACHRWLSKILHVLHRVWSNRSCAVKAQVQLHITL